MHQNGGISKLAKK